MKSTVVAATLILALAAPANASAQFLLPIPPVLPDTLVFREDVQMQFKRKAGLDSLMKLAYSEVDDDYRKNIDFFCTSEHYEPKEACAAALQPGPLARRLLEDDNVVKLTRQPLLWMPSLLPWKIWFMPQRTRSDFASYLRHSGLADGFDFASQFGASFGENEAYVASNVVRGVAGSYLFSADYAVVVTKAEGDTPEQRHAIENDKASVLRAINNGGTIAGHVAIPFWAAAGGTASNAFGATIGGGFLGPVTETGDKKRRALWSVVGENLTSIALRSLNGSFGSNSSIQLGVRAGLGFAPEAVKEGGVDKTIRYGQVMIGLRQNQAMALSALITMTESNYKDLAPRLVVNYSASIR